MQKRNTVPKQDLTKNDPYYYRDQEMMRDKLDDDIDGDNLDNKIKKLEKEKDYHF